MEFFRQTSPSASNFAVSRSPLALCTHDTPPGWHRDGNGGSWSLQPPCPAQTGWGPSHCVSLSTMLMLSQPLLAPLAVLAGRDRPEQGWAHRCQGSACTSPWLVCVSDGPILLDLVSPRVTIPLCLGQFSFLLEEGSRKAHEAHPDLLLHRYLVQLCQKFAPMEQKLLLGVIPQSSASALELPGQPVLLCLHCPWHCRRWGRGASHSQLLSISPAQRDSHRLCTAMSGPLRRSRF